MKQSEHQKKQKLKCFLCEAHRRRSVDWFYFWKEVFMPFFFSEQPAPVRGLGDRQRWVIGEECSVLKFSLVRSYSAFRQADMRGGRSTADFYLITSAIFLPALSLRGNFLTPLSRYVESQQLELNREEVQVEVRWCETSEFLWFSILVS